MNSFVAVKSLFLISYRCDSPIDLSGVGALCVGVFRSGHFQETHAEGVHIHQLIVVLLVHLRRHELGRTLNANTRGVREECIFLRTFFLEPVRGEENEEGKEDATAKRGGK